MSRASVFPFISEISASTVVPGHAARMARTHLANCSAPPSGRSSRVEQVSTTCRRFSFFAAFATFMGSSGSGGRGRPVVTLQNRVQTLPRIINVAVCFR